jgi:hypothetical protein
MLALAVVSAPLFALGWVNRLASHFAEQQIALARNTVRDGQSGPVFPMALHTLPPDVVERIRDCGVHHLWNHRKRIAWLGIVARRDLRGGADIIRRVVDGEPDPRVRTTMLRLLVLNGSVQDLHRFGHMLESTDAELRALGADGVWMCREQSGLSSYGSLGMWALPVRALEGDPPVIVTEPWFSRHGAARTPRNPTEGWTPALRARLWQMATGGTTTREQEAARRALVSWPVTDYRLRVAEWGVWLADGANIKLASSVIDAIPPFVHRTGDSVENLKNRVGVSPWMTIVTKPVVHITTRDDMCVDMALFIRQGRPWYVYPRPDDYIFGTPILLRAAATTPLSTLDPPGGKPLDQLHSGVPWLLPPREQLGVGTDLERLPHWGVRWESLLVTPEKPGAAKLADVPADRRFAWWEHLRRVPSSYVTNRGETERFLYYDGPTLARVPVRVKLKDGTLVTTHPVPAEWPMATEDDRLTIGQGGLRHDALYVEVGGKGAEAAPVAVGNNSVVGQKLPKLKADAPGQLLAMLIKAGLTKEEAQGLLDSWHEEFFQAKGRRLLLFLAAGEYAELCPMQIMPKPTESVRVGIILYEFDK